MGPAVHLLYCAVLATSNPLLLSGTLSMQGDSKAAKGVVLFMHGFAQGPNAYYENLQGLADAGFLVVAPVPPFGATPGKQQVRLGLCM